MELELLFDRIDRDGNGWIDGKELYVVCAVAAIDVVTMAQMFEAADVNRDVRDRRPIAGLSLVRGLRMVRARPENGGGKVVFL